MPDAGRAVAAGAQPGPATTSKLANSRCIGGARTARWRRSALGSLAGFELVRG